MSLKHFVTWKVSIRELKHIIQKLKETPAISLPITQDVELLIILQEVGVEKKE